jgi:hypothetical protein
MAAHLMGEDSQQMQSLGMAGGDRQTLPITPFGVGQAIGLMMTQGFGEKVLNRRQEFGGKFGGHYTKLGLAGFGPGR